MRVVCATEMGGLVTLPTAVAIIGGGVIAVEYATVLGNYITPYQHTQPLNPPYPTLTYPAICYYMILYAGATGGGTVLSNPTLPSP